MLGESPFFNVSMAGVLYTVVSCMLAGLSKKCTDTIMNSGTIFSRVTC